MPIRFRCQCGKSVKVAEEFAGKHAKCPNCGADLLIPRSATAPGTLPPKSPIQFLPGRRKHEAPEAELELEVERFGPGGKTGDPPAAEPLDFEEDAPKAESKEDASAKTHLVDTHAVKPPPAKPKPPPSAPAAEQPEAEGPRCPNCGAAASADSVICVECGANLTVEQPPAAAAKKSSLLNSFRLLREHKSFPVVAAVAAVLVIAVVTIIVLRLGKTEQPASTPVTQNQQPPPPKPPEKVTPVPTPAEFRWADFSGPAILERGRILRVGQGLAAYFEKNHGWPATLGDAGISMADSDGCKYVGEPIAALKRFRPLACEEKAGPAGEPFMLFSDFSARQVPAALAASTLPVKTDAGWLTPAESALLAKTAPQIRVANVRFTSLEVALDGKPAGTAPRGGVCVASATAGKHTITFTVGGQTDSVQLELKPGVIYTFVHPHQVDLPVIPVRTYRTAMELKTTSYEVRKDGRLITSLKSAKDPVETVTFPSGDGKAALSADLRSIAAVISRENLTIEGPGPGEPILVNELARMEAGVVRYNGDVAVVYHKTVFGPLRSEELPNMESASLAMAEADKGKAPANGGPSPRWIRQPGGNMPGTMPPPIMMPPPMTLPPGPPMSPDQPQPPAPVPEAAPPPQLAFPSAVFTPAPDCQALAAALSACAPGAVQLLLLRAGLPDVKPPEAPPVLMPPMREMPPPYPPISGTPPPFPPVSGMPPSPAPTREAPAFELSFRLRDIPRQLVYDLLAVYGNSSALPLLSTQRDKTAPDSPAYPALLLALARSGRGQALEYLQKAAEKTPTPAAIALCTIDEGPARKALGEVIATWTPAEVTEAVDEWPLLAGPVCRIAFVEALASSNPTLLDNLEALNALMKLEPFALERALSAHLAADPAAKPTPPEPPAPVTPPTTPPEPVHPAATAATATPTGTPLSWMLLARFRNAAAVAQFVRLLNDSDPAKRLHAATALAEVRDPSVTPLLIALLRQEKDGVVLRAAARSLTEMPDADVLKALAAAMNKDLLVAEIPEQAQAMAAKGGAELTALLLAKMLTFSLPDKAPANTPGAGNPPMPAQPPPPGTMPAGPAVEPGMATPATILDALGRVGSYPRDVNAAIQAACKSFDPAVRALAYQARQRALAGVAAPERSSSALAAAELALMPTEPVVVRLAGVGLLSLADPKAAVNRLKAVVVGKDADAEVRAAAVRALAEKTYAADPHAGEIIRAALADASPAVVAAAARAAAKRHDAAFGAALVEALKRARDPSSAADQPALLVALAEATAELQPKDAAGWVSALLNHPQPEVRIAAARALARLKGETALHSLLSVVQEADAKVLAEIVAALAEFDAPEAVQASLDALAKDANSTTIKDTLPPELRKKILARLASHCADSKSPYGEWLAKPASVLKDSDLELLAVMAVSGGPELRPGMIAIGKRYMAEARPETKARGAAILAKYSDDPAVRKTLLSAAEQDAGGIGQAVAEAIGRVHDDSMIDRPLLAYYEKLCEGAVPAPSLTVPTTPPTTTPTTTPTTPVAYPGLAKASAEENAILRAAIIEAIGNIGGDHAARALRRIADLERRRTTYAEEMSPRLIAAFEKTKSAAGLHSLCECFVARPGRYTTDAIAAATRMAALNPPDVTKSLDDLVKSPLTAPESAAAAWDALEEIKSAGAAS